MKHLAIERLKEAIRSEYPAGQVTFRTHDARAILALLGEGADPGADAEDLADDWADAPPLGKNLA